MTPADRLRAAASLMRDRAASATAGPWGPVTHDEVCVGVWAPDAGWYVTVRASDFEPASADLLHIASWDPLVAEAVADLLDAEATAIDDRLGVFTPTSLLALRIAAAYLAEVKVMPSLYHLLHPEERREQ